MNISISSLPNTVKTSTTQSSSLHLHPDVVVGNGAAPLIIAGPCTLESFEHTVAIGLALKKAGATVLRGSIKKPRTSPYSFQGWSCENVVWHYEAKKIHGLLTETEVLDIRDVSFTAEHVDILRIGARNMQNFPLLEEVSHAHRPVLLKRNPAATLEEFLSAAEYLLKTPSCPGVILCERGIRTFERSTRYTLDLNSVVLLKEISSLPVLVDPSHAVGKASLVPALAKAAIAAGADGIIVEVHESPEQALCDSQQHISLETCSSLIQSINKIFHS